MRALLMLFLVDQVATGGMGLDDRTATAIYGLYTAAVYIWRCPAAGWRTACWARSAPCSGAAC